MRQGVRQPRILVVDDDRHLCALLDEVLADAGYVVLCAYDGEAAWTEIQACPPDLVLSDITMPRLDGPGLARRIAGAGVGIPLILMSAGNTGDAAARAPILHKPFALDALLEHIARALQESDGANAPPAPELL